MRTAFVIVAFMLLPVAASADLFGMVGQWTAYFYKKTDGTLVLAHLQLAANHASFTGKYQITAGTCSASGPFTAARLH